MKSKSLFTMIAILIVASMVLAACGGGAVEEPVAEEPMEEPAAEEPAAEEPAAEEPMMEFEGKSVEAPDCDYGGKIKSIVAVDAYTVEFSMCKPDPAFPQKAAFTPFGIYPEEWLDANANEANQETLLSAPVGTGPFMLDNWARGESITFKAYDGYWGDKPAYDTLVFRWATEGAQRLLELQSGQVDQITNLSPDD